MKEIQNKSSRLTITTFIRALFKKETPFYIKATVGTALLYTLVPLDLLPDIFGPLGFADDAAVIGLLTTIAMSMLNHFNQKQQAMQTEPVNK